METTTTKEYFQSIRDKESHIKMKIRQLGELRVQVMNISARISDDRVQTSKSQGKLDGMMATIIDLENEIVDDISDYYTIYNDVMNRIKDLTFEEQDVVIARYLMGKTFAEIADMTQRSRRNVIYTHNRALNKISL